MARYGVITVGSSLSGLVIIGSWSRLGSVGFLFVVLFAAIRWLWAGSPRVNLERVCDSLDVPIQDEIREAERAE
jgi:hypothetical protein